MAQRTVLKVDIWCPKCQKKLLQAVSGLEGVNTIDIDATKGLLTVTGEADPYEVIVRARKACKHAEVVTIGPPPAPSRSPKMRSPNKTSPEKRRPNKRSPIARSTRLTTALCVSVLLSSIWTGGTSPMLYALSCNSTPCPFMSISFCNMEILCEI
ncbi:hypothetical protein CK203_006202 [Vitis vinifera]|uniref:HMA domain-containing protein n=1 Tax=Vitis vinifera TaxID=29760 RepID=A0A438K5E8_VITVI|nr:hypothetical protein CK203_006202 [Vitis vinifera]